MEIEIHYAQRHSKVSESAVQNADGCPGYSAGAGGVQNVVRLSRMFVKLKTVVLNDTPKCRSRLSKMGTV